MSSAEKICPTCGTEYPANERFCPRDGTALRTQSGDNDLVGSIIAERYHVLKKLGEGGMGQVYLAEHVKMGRKSAVKVMNPGMVNDADAISRFNREASNASRINHPNVAGIYDFGETAEGLIYLAMEYVEGESLTAVMEANGALPPRRAAEITRQAADALSVAHDMGIVHRDLKPDNIMLARNRDGSDCVKVVDFGIAKAAGSENQKVTKTGLVVGTPEYMSPEQLAGDKLDGRSDLYSLALVAFNMLTGTLPFPSETAQESMIMRLTDRPQTLAAMKPDVAWPAEVQSVMDRALERDAKLRYQSAQEFGIALWQAVERMPARPMVGGATMAGAAAGVGAAQPTVPGTSAAAAGGAAPFAPDAIPLSVSAPGSPGAGNQRKLLIGGGVLVAAAVVSILASRMMTPGAGAAARPDAATSPLTSLDSSTRVAASPVAPPPAPLPATTTGTVAPTQTQLSTPISSMPAESRPIVEPPRTPTPTTRPAPAPGTVESSIRSYSSELHSLIEAVNDPASARRAETTLRGLRDKAHAAGDVAAMDLIAAKIALFTVSGTRGCDMMSHVARASLDAPMRKELDEAVSTCGSP